MSPVFDAVNQGRPFVPIIGLGRLAEVVRSVWNWGQNRDLFDQFCMLLLFRVCRGTLHLYRRKLFSDLTVARRLLFLNFFNFERLILVLFVYLVNFIFVDLGNYLCNKCGDKRQNLNDKHWNQGHLLVLTLCIPAKIGSRGVHLSAK